MKTFEQVLDEIRGALTEEQIQLLKDTINFGSWGDCDMDFKGEDGGYVLCYCFGYITNFAQRAGHFSGRKVSAMFRSIYKRLGMLGSGGGSNDYFCYANDWWGDGSGSVIFIREEYIDDFENWAKNE